MSLRQTTTNDDDDDDVKKKKRPRVAVVGGGVRPVGARFGRARAGWWLPVVGGGGALKAPRALLVL